LDSREELAGLRRRTRAVDGDVRLGSGERVGHRGNCRSESLAHAESRDVG
jgi:hypothetical protein